MAAAVAAAMADAGLAPPAARRNNRMLCILCQEHNASWLNEQCRHKGPCLVCLPSKDDWQTRYKTCATCGIPASTLYNIFA